METKKKNKTMIEFEIDNCLANIEFYRKEICNMEEKVNSLEKLKNKLE